MGAQAGIARGPLQEALSGPIVPAAAIVAPSFERRGVSIAVLEELLRQGQQWHSGRRVLLVRHDRLCAASFAS